MMEYKEWSWDEHDLIACNRACHGITMEFGEEEAMALGEAGCFGFLDYISVIYD